MIEEPAGMRAFFDEVPDRSSILSRIPGVISELTSEVAGLPADQPCLALDWDPIPVGQRFWVVPPSHLAPTPSGRLRIEVEPSMAFGTGRHESTQLCMQALERHLQPGMAVLDAGCGSGILSAAARALGAGPVIACDIHPDSASEASSRANVSAFLGSLDALQSERFDLVLANISARVVDRLAAELRRVTRPTGLIVIAGFLTARPPLRFHPEETQTLGEWACWTVRPGGIAVPLQPDPEESPDRRARWWLA